MKRQDRIAETEKLLRFLHATAAGKIPDNEAKMAGIRAIRAQLTSLNSPGSGRKPRKQYDFNSPQFDVAVRLVEGTLKPEQAKREMMALCNCPRSTAADHLKELLPRAKGWVSTKRMLDGE